MGVVIIYKSRNAIKKAARTRMEPSIKQFLQILPPMRLPIIYLHA